MFFPHCMLNILRYEKIFCEICDCFIAQSIKSCDVSGVHSESTFPFMEFFFPQKNCFLWSPCLLLIAESINLDTCDKPTVGFS